jgi:crotonobetainyl-CoA:carnitine CoA-transferase CaiB-like acyl-CoA transferase
LGYFGAEVVKIEPPGTGDPLRGWRTLDESGTALWWYSLGRNKKCITLDLRQEAGQRLARQLAERADVLMENFRPGTLERWGLGPADLEKVNPRLIVSRISGYGQDGPYAHRPGFAAVCEAVGGLRAVTGFPDGPPVRSNLSLGDSLAGLHAAFGILLALYHRDREGGRRKEAGTGQVVDTAIYESVFNMLEAVVPEFDRTGQIRGPSGSTITGIVPSNSYLCADGEYVIISGNSEPIFQRLMDAAGRPDLGKDPRLGSNAGRVEHQEEVDGALAAWTATLPAAEVLQRLEAARVPAGPIHTVADMMADPHFQARGLFEEVEAGGAPLKIPAFVPKLSETPGSTEWPGPALGTHTEEVLEEWLGVSGEEVAVLREKGVV